MGVQLTIKQRANYIYDLYLLNQREFLILMKWSTPLIVSNLLNNVTYLFVNLIFVGRLSREELAAAALANTWTYCTNALGAGVTNAMDTLISQSYGAGNNKLVSLTVQRASVVATFTTIFIAVLWALTEKVLLAVQQDPEISYLAFKYALYLLPGLWFSSISTVLQKYLQGQAIMWPSIITGLVLNGFNALFNYILIHGTGSFDGIGFVGSPLATSISRIMAFFLMLIIIKVFQLHKETWGGWSKEIFRWHGYKEYLKLGIPASIQHASEGWGFEILTILAGLIGAAELDAHSVVYNFTMLTYQFPSAIGTAVSVRVGQLLGQGNERRAKASAWVAFIISLFFMVAIAIVQYTCRHVIGKIYTNDEGVIEIAATILPISAIFQIFDGGQTIFQGIVRGMGRVKVGALANFIAFYVISIPIGVILAFPVDVGVTGLWWGLCIGLVAIFIGLSFVIFKVDWVLEVSKAAIRTMSTSSMSPPKFNEKGEMIEMDSISIIRNEDRHSLDSSISTSTSSQSEPKSIEISSGAGGMGTPTPAITITKDSSASTTEEVDPTAPKPSPSPNTRLNSKFRDSLPNKCNPQ
ncbi:multi antimicrobial extrusion family protein [Tieghemostelium lacteum]|uniref:Multi antimicrobial extrusion family protein n=1 Tax=Tieghemostelium lacteum TaxID=361077 RepID=A0A152A2C1_TIELA|nr:multi antimicrobial extrusion family protein [Tieghemostelium lacteum]|eukprot:KYR00211.1 multi antimicrobial extrusion family protein [Tieghemostelium lacteum]